MVVNDKYVRTKFLEWWQEQATHVLLSLAITFISPIEASW
jgi:hypothetical protein